MLKTRLVRGSDQEEYCTEDAYDGCPVLVTTEYAKEHGVFKTLVFTSSGTEIIVEAFDLEGLVITDLILSAEKKDAIISIQFTDAVNTENILVVNVIDKGMTLAHAFQGKWAGWQGCDIKIVTDKDVDGSIAIGYYRTPEDKTLAYEAWDAER